MSITKKHLNQLAKIVATLHNETHFSKDMQSIVIVSNLIESFATNNCENFDHRKWSTFIAKQIELDKKKDEMIVLTNQTNREDKQNDRPK